MSANDLPSTDAPIVCIVGPTAVGKTALAVEMARLLDGEIINADSRQVYRGMTIGTAKPGAEERAVAPHHLLDILDPPESYGLGLFLESAAAALGDIRHRSRLPIVCGGAGQYVWALAAGQTVPAVPPDPRFRAERLEEASRLGPGALHDRLATIDPVRAAALDHRNVRRVIRALEIHHHTGRLPSEIAPPEAAPVNACVLGLTMSREALYRRIDDRVDRMMQDGFLEEVSQLLASGVPPGLGPMDSPGYRELAQHLNREISLDEAVRRAKTQTHRLARRQYTWFKLADPRIDWLDATDPALVERATGVVSSFLNSPPPVLQ